MFCIVCPRLQASGNAVANGVPVIDVSALEQSADSSNESAASVSGHQGDSTHDSDPTQPSPHFITVTGRKFPKFICVLFKKHACYCIQLSKECLKI